ncbi:MAG: hypothetical protein LBR29_12270 [Methylobacteriaceae bacterium]|jgi:hypothetical protein|nr:hypothetical protein [Methylobacteriaceae bacterium]
MGSDKITFMDTLRAIFNQGQYPDDNPAPAAETAAEPVFAAPDIDETPDFPVPFGYNICWSAVKSSNPEDVAKAFGLTDVRPANWASGIETAYGSAAARASGTNLVFVTPPMHGWVLVAGQDLVLPESDDRLPLTRMMEIWQPIVEAFPDVQLFASHRGSDCYSWSRAVNGEWARVFAYVDGGVVNFGAQTPDEARLNLLDLSGMDNRAAAEALGNHQDTAESLPEGERKALINEDTPPAVANLWSVDPRLFDDVDEAETPSLGLVGKLPKELTSR